MIFTSFPSWLIAINNVSNRNDYLTRLLVQKKHPAVYSPHLPRLSSCDLTPGKVYHVMKGDNDILSPEQISTVLLPLMESRGYFIDYFKAKDEIKAIEHDSRIVDAFAADLFS